MSIPGSQITRCHLFLDLSDQQSKTQLGALSQMLPLCVYMSNNWAQPSRLIVSSDDALCHYQRRTFFYYYIYVLYFWSRLLVMWWRIMLLLMFMFSLYSGLFRFDYPLKKSLMWKQPICTMCSCRKTPIAYNKTLIKKMVSRSKHLPPEPSQAVKWKRWLITDSSVHCSTHKHVTQKARLGQQWNLCFHSLPRHASVWIV